MTWLYAVQFAAPLMLIGWLTKQEKVTLQYVKRGASL